VVEAGREDGSPTQQAAAACPFARGGEGRRDDDERVMSVWVVKEGGREGGRASCCDNDDWTVGRSSSALLGCAKSKMLYTNSTTPRP